MSLNNLPLVSIVIPVYNREILVKKALDAAIAQTYPNIEVVVNDNNSTDNTYEVVRGYLKDNPQIKLFRNEQNVGPVNNWLQGIKNASGDYVKILFSDDWISDDYIEKTMLQFTSQVGLVFTPAIIRKKINITNYKLFKSTKIINSALFLKFMLLAYRTPVSPGCAIFRKVDILPILSTVIDTERHAEYLRFGAGIDLLTYLMVAEKYDKIAYVSDTYAHFLEHDDSFTYANALDQYYIKAFDHFLERTKKVKFKSLYSLIHHSRGYKFIRHFSNK
ncbi:glycosyltransferase family 2 protein [Mucilaginibacter myungsuensis]|uniref:Glycosyltransferase family 2 protein n=1 Tax=Mucilaginibacter myungsuensis TaxID=649104 RepID=A0A929PWS7_9SPHI|nr:glycosyltransferase family 2 protein [Mucilaginibacter myungsuensis]MBE9662406.1 glycosyltransferase family 2 protein [Mucilaginibacter myungsuensis]MDN3599157.1 glycosyltransferase family 2 protein [Mucilaginibacter myungsuensis]